jgi:hypothetical protein
MDLLDGTDVVIPSGTEDDEQTDRRDTRIFTTRPEMFSMTKEQPKGRYARLKNALATGDATQRGRRSILLGLLAFSSVPVVGTGSWLCLTKSVVVRDGWVLSSDD